jgi:hypothetical protein
MQQQPLGIIDQEEQHGSHKTEQQQRDKDPDGIELSLRDKDLETDAAAAGHEFADDRADQRERDRHLHAGEQARQRAGKADLHQHRPRRRL